MDAHMALAAAEPGMGAPRRGHAEQAADLLGEMLAGGAAQDATVVGHNIERAAGYPRRVNP